MYSLFARLRQLILPGTAQPNDPAIIEGPDLPPCMQARYSAAIFFRPPNTASGGANAAPWKFYAQVKAPSPNTIQWVEEGYAIWDQSSICGFVVYRRSQADNFGGGALAVADIFGQLLTGGTASFASVPAVVYGLTGAPAFIRIGDPTQTPGDYPLTVDSVSLARGLRASAASAVNSAAIAAEAVVLTTGAMTFYDGRAYELRCECELLPSVANRAGVSFRLNNLAGALLVSASYNLPGQAHASFVGYVRRTAGTDLTAVIVQTLVATAGTVTQVGAVNTVRTIEVRDCGAAADYPNAITV